MTRIYHLIAMLNKCTHQGVNFKLCVKRIYIKKKMNNLYKEFFLISLVKIR